MDKNLNFFWRAAVSALLAFSLTVLYSCGNDDDEKNDRPATAGTISGDDSGTSVVVLEIGVITGADTYKWYKDGVEVQNTAFRTYMVTETGTYKVAGVNSFGEGGHSPEKTVTITAPVPPADAGEIQGDSEGETEVVLTIGEIQGANTYRWYKDGEQVQDNDSRTYTVTQSGTYTVAGVNADGEGKASPEKRVTITGPVEYTYLPYVYCVYAGDILYKNGYGLLVIDIYTDITEDLYEGVCTELFIPLDSGAEMPTGTFDVASSYNASAEYSVVPGSLSGNDLAGTFWYYEIPGNNGGILDYSLVYNGRMDISKSGSNYTIKVRYTGKDKDTDEDVSHHFLYEGPVTVNDWSTSSMSAAQSNRTRKVYLR